MKFKERANGYRDKLTFVVIEIPYGYYEDLYTLKDKNDKD